MENVDVAAIALAAQGAGTVTYRGTNLAARGMVLTIDVTAVGGTPSMVVSVYGRDSVSGKRRLILASAAITAVGTSQLRIYPGLTAAANAAANDVVPLEYDVEAVVSGTTPAVTATVAACLIV